MSDLKELFESIEVQSYPNMEILVVVERSKAICRFAREYKSKYPKKVYFTKEKIGVSNARNIGVSLSSGEIIAFVDDDAILSDDWSAQLLESFARYPKVIGVTGKSIAISKSTNLSGFPHSLYWTIGCTRPGLSGQWLTNFATGTNMAYRREAFDTHRFELNIHGDQRSRAIIYHGLPNDENDFAVRLSTDLNRPILFNSQLIVFHKVTSDRITPSYVMHYSFWQGAAEARYWRKTAWKKPRQSVYESTSRTLVHDLFPTRIGPKAWITRCAFIFLALTFTVLGFVALQKQFAS